MYSEKSLFYTAQPKSHRDPHSFLSRLGKTESQSITFSTVTKTEIKKKKKKNIQTRSETFTGDHYHICVLKTRK